MLRATTRETAIQSIQALLSNLPMHTNKGNFEDAIRMVDRAIGGVLGHPDSPVVSIFRSNQQILFPSGLENTCQGKDIVLVLNSRTVDIKNPIGQMVSYTLPKALKNPEKGIAQIVGLDLAKKLFAIRGKIFLELLNKDKNWQANLEANQNAESVLIDYPYQLAKVFIKDILSRVTTEMENKRFLSSLEFLDNSIRSLLAQPQSKMSCAINRYAKLFSSHVVYSSRGKDLIALLTSDKLYQPGFFGKDAKPLSKSIDVPRELKNPAKGLENILGGQLTCELFSIRKRILIELMKEDKQWSSSLQANDIAEQMTTFVMPSLC